MEPAHVSLTIDIPSCTACKACELACSFIKHGHYSLSHSRIQVLQVYEEGVNVPIVCINCEEAPCMDVCPTEAITRDDKLGIVSIEGDLCTGCGECVEVCFYGAIHIPEKSDIALMCDLCGGDPACVPSCIYGALKFELKPDTAYAAIEHDFANIHGEERKWNVAEELASQVRLDWEVRP